MTITSLSFVRILARSSGIVCAAVGAAGVVALAACGTADDGGSYFPLAAGYNWHYRIERTTMDGTSELRHALVNVAPPAGAAIAGARETAGGRRYLYAIDDEGIHRIAGEAPGAAVDGTAAERQLVLPHRLEAGRSWRGTTRTSVLESAGPPWETLFRIDVPVDMQYAIEAAGTQVSTPAGRFDDCLLVSGRGSANVDVGNYIGRTDIEVVTREWFAPGVGLVRMERLESTTANALNAGSMVMELESWNE